MKFTLKPFLAGAASVCIVPSLALAQEETSRIHFKAVAVNVLLGGLTAGIFETAHRRPFWTAFAKGAAGGAAIVAGKCLIGEQRAVTDWLGRGTVAVGSSMVANAAQGRSLFRRVVLPVGPVRLYRDDSTRRFSVKLDVAHLATATFFATRERSNMDWKKSFQHGGTIVFDPVSVTVESAGVIRNWQNLPGKTLVHEQVHVAQGEFLSTVLEEPLERYLLDQVPGGKVVHRYFDLGILLPVWAVANAMIPHVDRPWEKDANAFEYGC